MEVTNDMQANDDDVEVDFIENWDNLDDLGNGDQNDDDVAVLIVDDDADKEDTTSNRFNNKIDYKEVPILKLTKEETAFNVTRMSMNELFRCRDMDRKATAYRRCKFKCLSCITGYYQEMKYKKHCKLRHEKDYQGKERRYKCVICETRFHLPHTLNTHYEKHFRKYSCTLCNYSHHKLAAMFVHKMKKHKDGTIFKCKVCDMEFDRRHTLDWHLKSHKEKPECEICGKPFSSRTNLKAHMTIHSDQDVQCTECGLLVGASILVDHMREHRSTNPGKYGRQQIKLP